MISKELLKQRLLYSPETGEFVWINSVRPGWNGKTAGLMTKSGYIRIEIEGRKYMAHRLAWLYVFGNEPNAEVDHINGNRSDNRIANLREATRPQNMQNKRKYLNNSSGLTGVSWSRVRNKWAANIQVGNIQKNLGFFASKEEAYLAYLKAKSEKHTFHPMTRA